MERWTFEIQWPAPFAKGWKRSSRSWPSPRLAGEEMTEYLLVSLENGVILEGRIVKG